MLSFSRGPYTYICILIRSNSDELGLGEEVCLEGVRVPCLTRPHLNHVDTGLILVHGVNHDLKHNHH